MDELQVLIVDDDIATVDVIEKSVRWESLGIGTIFTAYDIDAAKKIIRQEQIDIIISDIEMPQGSGLDLLEWLRGEKYESEFLLLTCHERFDYASYAIKLQASEYLLKPFNVSVMEVALRKLIMVLAEKRQIKKESQYGKWVIQNKRQLHKNYWKQLLMGNLLPKEAELVDEIKKQGLSIDEKADYRLVLSKITGMAGDREKMTPSLMQFVMENIHSEILCGNPENESAVCFENDDTCFVCTVCNSETLSDMKAKTQKLVESHRQVFHSDITCCISHQVKLWELYDVYRRDSILINRNVLAFGSYFAEEEMVEEENQKTVYFDFVHMQDLLEGSQKMEFLSYLKTRLNDSAFQKHLNSQVLKQMEQEILQAVYTYLGKKQIQAAGLFVDETLNTLSEQGSRSVIDLIRWANFLLEKTFSYEQEVQKQFQLSDRIDKYIMEHYMEDIGRNEIAQEFYLSPEHISKTYKKQTGKNLKDAIAEYRIAQAKILLERGERVIDVAEKVGFENQTYFSTLFKKYTGISPNQYRQK